MAFTVCQTQVKAGLMTFFTSLHEDDRLTCELRLPYSSNANSTVW